MDNVEKLTHMITKKWLNLQSMVNTNGQIYSVQSTKVANLTVWPTKMAKCEMKTDGIVSAVGVAISFYRSFVVLSLLWGHFCDITEEGEVQ